MAQKKSNNRIIWILLGVVVLLVILAQVAKKAGIIGKPTLQEVTIVEAKAASIVETVTASGTVQPEVEIAISPEVSGEIITLTVEEGDSVTAGQLLVRINPEIFRQGVNRAEAQLNQAKANAASQQANLARANANLTRQELDFNRQKQLFEQRVTSSADWETAQANYEVAQQDQKAAQQTANAGAFNVQSAQAALEDARENLNRTSIYAPASGTISKLNVDQGERVVGTSQMAGTEMLRIANLLAMEVRVNVNENDISRVSLGDTAIIDVDAYAPLEKQFKGIVTAIANTANDRASADAVTEFEVKIRILNSSYADLLAENPGQSPFRPGMTASVDIRTDRKDNVLAVPLAAVTTRPESDLEKAAERAERAANATEGDEEEGAMQDDSDWEDSDEEEEELECVFVLQEDNSVTLREVTTGIKDFDNIEILSGLEKGDRIVSGPYLAVSRRLKDGDMVQEQKKKGRRPNSGEEE